MKTRLLYFIGGLCCATLCEHTMWAQSTIYSDFGQFYLASQAVPGNWQSISLSPPGIPSDEIGPVLTIGNVTFSGRYLLREIDSSFSTVGPVLYNFDSDIPLHVHFATGSRAFGADFSSYLSPSYSSFTATLSLDDGETFSFTAPTNPNSTFFGFISPTPIMDLTFSDGGLFGFGNLHEEFIGNIIVVTVPEPFPSALFGMGGLLIAARMLQRRLSEKVKANQQAREISQGLCHI
jgi:hypothetical protein